MNAHALAAMMTRQPETHPTTEEWIAHTAAVTLAWSALDAAFGRKSRAANDEARV